MRYFARGETTIRFDIEDLYQLRGVVVGQHVQSNLFGGVGHANVHVALQLMDATGKIIHSLGSAEQST